MKDSRTVQPSAKVTIAWNSVLLSVRFFYIIYQGQRPVGPISDKPNSRAKVAPLVLDLVRRYLTISHVLQPAVRQ